MDLVELKNIKNTRHPWELARLEIVYRILQYQLIKMNKPKIKLLDVGSGDGYFIREICKRVPSAEAVAVDTHYTDEIINLMQSSDINLNKRITYYRDLDKAPAQDYDVVFLLDVIEHVESVNEIFNAIEKKLTQNAIFIVTVPAFQKMFSSHDVFLKHYRRYNTKLLIHQLKQNKINVIQSGYFFFTLLLPRFFQIIKEKYFNKKEKQTGIGSWNKDEKTTRLITKILVADAELTMKMNLPGLSAYAVGELKLN